MNPSRGMVAREESWDHGQFKARSSPEKPHAQAKLLSPTEKCKICHEQAAKHVHYGAMTCFSCRAFFRRSIQNKTAATYVCRRNKECEINLKTRKNCQFCRYQKCIAVGMKPTWVLTEEERTRRFRKVREKQTVDNANSSSTVDEGYDMDENNLEMQSFKPPPAIFGNNAAYNGFDEVVEGVVGCSSSSSRGGGGASLADVMSEDYVEVKQDPDLNNVYIKHEIEGERSVRGPIITSTKKEVPESIEGPQGFGEMDSIVNSVSSSPQDTFYSSSSKTSQPSSQCIIQFVSPPVQTCINEEFVETSLDDEEHYSSSDDEAMMGGIPIQPIIVLTFEEELFLKNLIDTHNERYKSVNFGEELIKEMIMCSMFSIPVSTTAAINGYRICVERVTRIANSMELFTSLYFDDRAALLKENADLLVSLRGAIFFDSKKNGVDQVLLSMGEGDLETIRTMFSQLLKEDNMKHIDYKTFNSVQAVGQNPTEDRYNALQEKVAKSLSDEPISILLTMIMLFSRDFCTLSNAQQIQKAQDTYIRMLERYIASQNPPSVACIKFANCMDVVTSLREMADIKKIRTVSINVRI